MTTSPARPGKGEEPALTHQQRRTRRTNQGHPKRRRGRTKKTEEEEEEEFVDKGEGGPRLRNGRRWKKESPVVRSYSFFPRAGRLGWSGRRQKQGQEWEFTIQDGENDVQYTDRNT
jgi:hypothetical protein